MSALCLGTTFTKQQLRSPKHKPLVGGCLYSAESTL